eukprot:scaffold38508_cov57-Phaeocystis_antarctica.AAC.1
MSRNEANFQISRARANMDLQMISHQVQRVHTQSDGSVSLPDSLPAKRSISLAKAPTASLPPGPPSSSAGQSVAEQEVTVRSGAAGSGVAPAAPSPLAAPTVWPFPSLRHSSSSAAPKRPAQPETSASEPRAKRAYEAPTQPPSCDGRRRISCPLDPRACVLAASVGPTSATGLQQAGLIQPHLAAGDTAPSEATVPASSDSPLGWPLQAVMNACSLHATLTAPTPAPEVGSGSAESEVMEAVLTELMADEVVVLELQTALGSLPAQANPETVAAVPVPQSNATPEQQAIS